MAGSVPDTNTTVTIIKTPQNDKVDAPRIISHQKVFSDNLVFPSCLRSPKERHLCGKKTLLVGAFEMLNFIDKD